MCLAVAVNESEVPTSLLSGHSRDCRVFTRNDRRKVRFYWRAKPALLLVRWRGELRVLRWGTDDPLERVLPPCGWVWGPSIGAGAWAAMEAEPVDILATAGMMNRVWFAIQEGVRGLVVHDRNEEPVVFMVCGPATDEYRAKTKCAWMSVPL